VKRVILSVPNATANAGHGGHKIGINAIGRSGSVFIANSLIQSIESEDASVRWIKPIS
jgi:hypothetical protein